VSTKAYRNAARLLRTFEVSSRAKLAAIALDDV
jgi:hypothetical protein